MSNYAHSEGKLFFNNPAVLSSIIEVLAVYGYAEKTPNNQAVWVGEDGEKNDNVFDFDNLSIDIPAMSYSRLSGVIEYILDRAVRGYYKEICSDDEFSLFIWKKYRENGYSAFVAGEDLISYIDDKECTYMFLDKYEGELDLDGIEDVMDNAMDNFEKEFNKKVENGES